MATWGDVGRGQSASGRTYAGRSTVRGGYNNGWAREGMDRQFGPRRTSNTRWSSSQRWVPAPTPQGPQAASGSSWGQERRRWAAQQRNRGASIYERSETGGYILPGNGTTSTRRDPQIQYRNIIAQERREAAARRRDNRLKQRESAFQAYAKQWERLGLDGSQIMQALRGMPGYQARNPELVVEQIRKTKTWSDRFGAVFNARERNGLSFMDEGAIIAQEDTYRELLQPLGFGDSRIRNYAQNWIGTGASPNEIARRVDVAAEWANTQDKATLGWLRQNYGIKKRDLAAFVLDTSNKRRDAGWFEEHLREAQIGGEARRQGVKVNRNFAGKLVDMDVSRQEARQAFKQANETTRDLNQLAALSGERGFTEQGVAAGALGANKRVQKKENRLRSQERARWQSGAGGAGSGAFGGAQSGSF